MATDPSTELSATAQVWRNARGSTSRTPRPTHVRRCDWLSTVLLLDLVTAVRAELRTGDLIARWGGEEFAIALPNCDLDQAQKLCSRLLLVVPQGQTVSIGRTQATAATTQDTPRSMVERADLALYAAKNGGRNQVKTQQGPTPADGVHEHAGTEA